MKVFRTAVQLNGDNLAFFDIDEVECPQDFYDKFKWDKAIRFDDLHTNAVYFLSTDKKILDGLWLGWNLCQTCGTPQLMKHHLDKFKEDVDDRLGTLES